jgi:hypothetical protein
MSISGTHFKPIRFVQTDQFIVVVKLTPLSRTKPLQNPASNHPAVEFLKEVERHAKLGDKEWLMQHGRVYQRVNAA